MYRFGVVAVGHCSVQVAMYSFASPVRRSLDARGVFLECLPEPHILGFDPIV